MTCRLCDKPVHGWGLCNTHYQRWLRHGTTDERPHGSRPRLQTVCRECGRTAYCRDLCSAHYYRFTRYGNPTATPVTYRREPFTRNWIPNPL